MLITSPLIPLALNASFNAVAHCVHSKFLKPLVTEMATLATSSGSFLITAAIAARESPALSSDFTKNAYCTVSAAALTSLLNVLVAELLGSEPHTANAKPGPASQLQRKFEQVKLLPRKQQEFVIQFLDTVLKNAEKV